EAIKSLMPEAETTFEADRVVSPAIEAFVQRIQAGDVRAIARAISAIEDNAPEATKLLKAVFPYSGKARIVGLTGAPGSGKSTLVDQLAREYRRSGSTIGIIAVDPTSPYTGGAILGDRIRLCSHSCGIHARAGLRVCSCPSLALP